LVSYMIEILKLLENGDLWGTFGFGIEEVTGLEKKLNIE